MKDPADVQEYIRRLLRCVKQQGPDEEVKNLGKIAQILSVWLKSYELIKLEDIEKRLSELEKAGDKK